MVSTVAMATKAELKVRQTRGKAMEGLIMETTVERVTWMQIMTTLAIMAMVGLILAMTVLTIKMVV